MSTPETAEETIVKKKPLWKKILALLIKFGLAGLIIAWIVRGNADKIAENFKHFNYRWIIPALILYIFHLFVGGWRWYMLLKVLKFKIKLWEAICLTLKAYFCSLVIPGGAIGGDLAKVGFISVRAPKGAKVEGIFTILIDRITGMLALFITAIVLTLLSIPLLMNVDMPELYKALSDFMHINTTQEIIKYFKAGGIACVLLLCVSGLGACGVIFLHRQFRRISIINKLMEWFDAKTHGALTRMCNTVDIYRNEKMLLAWMTLISIFLIHLNMGAVMYCLLKGLGVDVVPMLALFTGVILGNIAGLIPFTPSGIGFRDYTVLKILSAGGIVLDKAESAAIMFTSVVLCSNLFAGLFFFINDGSKSRESEEQG